MMVSVEFTCSDPSIRPPLAQLQRATVLSRVARVLQGAIPLLALVTATAYPAELIVVDQAGCPFCERFEREIAPAWPNTDEGRDLPLRRVDLHGDWPADLASVEHATVTPTFILVEQGDELGRLVGYAGDDHFWFLIGQLLEQSDLNRRPVESMPTDDAGKNSSTEQ